jgi:hypothetical protein
MTRSNARIVGEYLREAGWRERTIGAPTRALISGRTLLTEAMVDHTAEIATRWRQKLAAAEA